jgi:hypothetical protein
MKPLWLVLTALAPALVAIPASAQPVISAKSGMIAKVEGTVLLGDQALEDSATHFPDIKENQVVRTEDGRTEILLTPGVFLRLGENGTVKMLSNRLIDTRVELVSGSAVVEADDIAKDTSVTVACKDATVTLSKAGVYRFDTEPARLKVFKGSAEVELGNSHVSVTGGKMVLLGGEMALQRFDADDTDALDRWSQRRGQYVAMANVSAAKSLLSSGASYSSLGWGLNNGPCSGAWGFNAYYGMMTYIPCRGTLNSPYGYMYWSPFTVMRAYYVPPAYYGGGRNYNNGFGSGGGMPSYSYPTASATSSGYSGTMAAASSSSSVGASAPAMSSAGSSAASSAGASSVGHGGGGGGAGGHGK